MNIRILRHIATGMNRHIRKINPGRAEREGMALAGFISLCHDCSASKGQIVSTLRELLTVYPLPDESRQA